MLYTSSKVSVLRFDLQWSEWEPPKNTRRRCFANRKYCINNYQRLLTPFTVCLLEFPLDFTVLHHLIHIIVQYFTFTLSLTLVCPAVCWWCIMKALEKPLWRFSVLEWWCCFQPAGGPRELLISHRPAAANMLLDGCLPSWHLG